MPATVASGTLEKFTTFGDLLRFLRRRVGLTQVELATEVGYSDTQISRLEQNLRLPDIPTIEARFVPALGLEDETETLTRLLDLAANVRREDAPAPGLCPYKGLSYFDEADADLFFGREALNEQLLERVLALAAGTDSGSVRFLAVVGASGSGKSSLVRAGLIPSLRWHRTSADWHMAVFTPTAHPLESLAATLTEENSSLTAITTLIDDMASDARSLRVLAKSRLHLGGGARLLLVVDQFEELFSLCRSEEERTAFIENLMAASSESDSPVIVVITLRADFYAYCAGYAQLREALARNQQYIGAMSDDELSRAIEEPALRGRWEFEPGLVDLLLYDVGHEPGALPLLSHALLETWQRRRGRTMTLGGYTSSQGVRGAIAETAETVFNDQFNAEQQAIARRIFVRLTELSDETTTTDTRRRATFDELILRPEEADDTRKVLKALADARLITTSEDSAEVAHEALIREWPTLRGWLEENRDSLHLHRQLTEAAQEWAGADRTEDALYRGLRLAQAREWAITHDEEMNALEREYLAESVDAGEREAREREARQQRELETARKLAEAEKQRAEDQLHSSEQLRRQANRLAVALVLAIMSALIAGYFWNQSRQSALVAEANERLAFVRELVAETMNNLEVDPERSILLGLRAVEVASASGDPAAMVEAETALHGAVLASHLRQRWTAHDGTVSSLAYSPDGERLASAGADGAAKIWDVNTGEQLLAIPSKAGESINALSFDPSGKRLALGDDSDNATVWDAATGELVLTLQGHRGPVTSIAYSDEGNLLMTGSKDGTAIIWDARTGEAQQTLSHDGAPLASVAFLQNPQGTRSATATTANDARTVRVWNNVQGVEEAWFEGNGTIAISPDNTIAAGRLDTNSVNLWVIPRSVRTLFSAAYVKGYLTGHTDVITGLAFSPNDIRLASASRDRSVRVWNTNTGEELLSLFGHAAPVTTVTFSPDGVHVASADESGEVRIWDAGPDHELLAVSSPNRWEHHPTELSRYGQTAFSPDGTRLYALLNLTEPLLTPISLVAVIDAVTGLPLPGLAETKGKSGDPLGLSMAVAPNGQYLAIGYENGEVRVIDSLTDQRIASFEDDAPIDALAFSPDSRRLALPGPDSTIQIVNLASGEQEAALSGIEGLVRDLAFSADGHFLAIASAGSEALIWDVLNGTVAPVGNQEAAALAYAPEGRQLVIGQSDGSLLRYDPELEQPLVPIGIHGSRITDVAISSDGRQLASSSNDGTLKVWDLATGSLVLSLPGGAGMSFGPDGDVLAANDGSNSIVRTYVLSLESLKALAQSRLTRTLSDEECREFLHLTQCADQP